MSTSIENIFSWPSVIDAAKLYVTMEVATQTHAITWFKDPLSSSGILLTTAINAFCLEMFEAKDSPLLITAAIITGAACTVLLAKPLAAYSITISPEIIGQVSLLNFLTKVIPWTLVFDTAMLLTTVEVATQTHVITWLKGSVSPSGILLTTTINAFSLWMFQAEDSPLLITPAIITGAACTALLAKTLAAYSIMISTKAIGQISLLNLLTKVIALGLIEIITRKCTHSTKTAPKTPKEPDISTFTDEEVETYHSYCIENDPHLSPKQFEAATKRFFELDLPIPRFHYTTKLEQPKTLDDISAIQAGYYFCYYIQNKKEFFNFSEKDQEFFNKVFAKGKNPSIRKSRNSDSHWKRLSAIFLGKILSPLEIEEIKTITLPCSFEIPEFGTRNVSLFLESYLEKKSIEFDKPMLTNTLSLWASDDAIKLITYLAMIYIPTQTETQDHQVEKIELSAKDLTLTLTVTMGDQSKHKAIISFESLENLKAYKHKNFEIKTFNSNS